MMPRPLPREAAIKASNDRGQVSQRRSTGNAALAAEVATRGKQPSKIHLIASGSSHRATPKSPIHTTSSGIWATINAKP